MNNSSTIAPERSSPAAVPAAEGKLTMLDSRSVVILAVAVGVLLRVMQYAGNRSLWLDEALVLPNVVGRSLGELVNPSTWGALPPGFLFLSRLSVLTLGSGEYALRLIPLLAGLASVFLFLAVARRYLSAQAVPLAMALFALSPFLIYYASDLKQYSSDAAITLVLLLFAYELHARGVTASRAAAWGVVGLAAAGMSMTALFVLAGVTAALIGAFLVQGDRRQAFRLGCVGAAWALAFGVPYLLFVHGAGKNPYLQAFWSSGFMPFPPRSLADLAWFPETFQRLFRDPLGVLDDAHIQNGFYQAAAGMVAFVAGCAWMGSRRRLHLAMLLGPVLAVLLASGMRAYPFGGAWVTEGRVLLFLVPAFLLVMAEGATQLYRRLGRGMRLVGVAVIALLVVPPLAQAAIAIPYGRSEIKPILAYVEENWEPGDLLYVHYEVRHAFEYYGPRHDLRSGYVAIGPCARFEPTRYLDALGHLLGSPRVWVLFGSGEGAREEMEHRLMKGFLDHFGTRLDDQVSIGTAVYLYDLRPTGEEKGRFTFQVPEVPYAIEEGCALWGGDEPANNDRAATRNP
jgi:4-amino-4-deoxy-L-arabinose transferase-like glycosyltransferase